MRPGPCCGALITAAVVLTAGASRLDHIAGVPQRPATTASVLSITMEGNDHSLHQLRSVWTDDRGKRLTLHDLRGSTLVLAMVFTRCPRSCPTLVHDLKQVEAALPADVRARTRFVLITIDPLHDTAAALREFRRHMGLDEHHWTLLRGSDSDTRELAAVLGFAYGKGNGIDYTHSSLVTVLDPGGVVTHQQTSVGTDPARLLAALESEVH